MDELDIFDISRSKNTDNDIKFGFDIYLPCSKYKGWLDDEYDPADDEGKVEDLKEAASLLEEEAGEEGDKHLI